MLARTIMLQGTASNVGKSVLCAALGRVFFQDGYRVAPFKAQNMALNSYVTTDGLEIGRAQGVQAEACGIAPSVLMNPILLKPKADMTAQVIVMGRPLADFSARSYRRDYLPRARAIVTDALRQLREQYELVVIEGAGSPAEINLKEGDIVNMFAAKAADAPVILVADIDRGGVFAHIVGTLELLEPDERDRVAGFIINKFRGDVSLLRPGLDWLEERTGKKVFGVIPYLPQIDIEDEDSVALEQPRLTGKGELDIAVIQLPHISNFTDLDPLRWEPDSSPRYVRSVEELGQPDAIILPGSKNTVEDLEWLWTSGLAEIVREQAASGRWVLGICGGYQMLGKELLDPEQTESEIQPPPGLGLLPVRTTFAASKATHQVKALPCPDYLAQWGELQGYEIHTGVTTYLDGASPLCQIVSRSSEACQIADGAVVNDGQLMGSYIHGILENNTMRRWWLNQLRRARGMQPLPGQAQPSPWGRKDQAYNRLAAHVRANLDLSALYALVGVRSRP